MIIKCAKSGGFCKSVQNAYNLAINASEKPVYILGQLVHNDRVSSDLLVNGIKEIDLETALSLTKGSIVIRAHGVSLEILSKLQQTPLTIIDATCPNIKKTQKLVQKAERDGYEILILGNSSHPEIIGINGWCNNKGIISNNGDFGELDPEKSYFLVSQTTFNPEKYNLIINKLKNTLKSLVIKDCICYTTKERKLEATVLAKECDAMIVIGSSKSSNAKGLVATCLEYCPNTYLIDKISDINRVVKQKIYKLGLIAGASTPKELIMEVINLMSNEEITKSEVITEGTKVAEAVAEEVKTESNNTPATEENAKNNKKSNQIKSMADWEAAENRKRNSVLHAGQKVYGEVVKADEKGIVVGIGEKKDGFISAELASIEEYNPSDYPVGTKIAAVVIPNEGIKDFITLDKKTVDERKKVDEGLMSGTFELKIEKKVDGGLVGSAGSYSVFVPASHVEPIKKGEEIDLDSYVGKFLTVKKLEDKDEKEKKNNDRRRRMVASHKIVVLEERQAKREESQRLWAEKKAKEEQLKRDIFNANSDRFEVDNMVPGTVKKFASFGAFVNVFGFDCLVANKEISWIPKQTASDVFEIGKEYQFVITKVDSENYKVSLSYKLLQKKPYELAQEKYPVGTIVKGKVEKLTDYGAFISIEPGVDGLVHIRNISDRRINSPSDVLKEGQEVDAKIIEFTDNRIALSLKDAIPQELEAEKTEAKPVRVKRTDKPAFDKKATKERKPRSNEENPEVKAEEDIVSAYGNTENATNTIGDLFKGIVFDNSDKE